MYLMAYPAGCKSQHRGQHPYCQVVDEDRIVCMYFVFLLHLRHLLSPHRSEIFSVFNRNELFRVALYSICVDLLWREGLDRFSQPLQQRRNTDVPIQYSTNGSKDLLFIFGIISVLSMCDVVWTCPMGDCLRSCVLYLSNEK